MKRCAATLAAALTMAAGASQAGTITYDYQGLTLTCRDGEVCFDETRYPQTSHSGFSAHLAINEDLLPVDTLAGANLLIRTDGIDLTTTLTSGEQTVSWKTTGRVLPKFDWLTASGSFFGDLRESVVGGYLSITFGTDRYRRVTNWSGVFDQGVVFSSTGSEGDFFGMEGSHDRLGTFHGSYWKVAPVPLPASGLLLLAALGGVAGLRHRRKAN
ncbi:VPLPA-CTERM sorting domain-containing protein [Rubellimicrobium arenae]|uniref:VPLPA-CTERM sorting domain-containing protein n=1 Tax=Rubellimicrobium arenae TaxID=2817372 RepID=UPI001FEE8F3F|nr:VPLPA-CTERM sorting domain-containing protein [Rubellimicrobium arenae]